MQNSELDQQGNEGSEPLSERISKDSERLQLIQSLYSGTFSESKKWYNSSLVPDARIRQIWLNAAFDEIAIVVRRNTEDSNFDITFEFKAKKEFVPKAYMGTFSNKGKPLEIHEVTADNSTPGGMFGVGVKGKGTKIDYTNFPNAFSATGLEKANVLLARFDMLLALARDVRNRSIELN